jgi:RNA polymerase sigma-70 factor (ECF subfamily)
VNAYAAESARIEVSDDLELASRCARGDRGAQRELFRREKRRVHATLFRVLGANVDIEDLMQDAWVELFRSLVGFRGEAKLSTWIDRITVRVAYAYLSRRPPRAARLEAVPEIAAGDPSAEQRAQLRQAAQRLYAVLDRIEPNQRIAFSLHVIDGRPLAAVAEQMSASLVTTKLRVWRARRQIEARARRDPLLAEFLGDSAGEG